MLSISKKMAKNFIMIISLAIVTCSGFTPEVNSKEWKINSYEPDEISSNCQLIYETTATKGNKGGESQYDKTDDWSQVGYYVENDWTVKARPCLEWDISVIPHYPNLIIRSADFSYDMAGQYPNQAVNMNMRQIVNYLIPKDASASFLWGDCGDGTTFETKELKPEGQGGYPVPFVFAGDNEAFIQELYARVGNYGFIAAGFHLASESSTYRLAALLPSDLMVDYTVNITNSGTLAGNEVWIETVPLAGNVVVPNGVTLTFEDGVSVSLNGYKISKESGGSFAFYGSATFNPDIRLVRSGSTVGYYPSVESALNDAQSTDEIQFRSNESWSSDMTITADVSVMSGATLTISAGKTISFGDGNRLTVYGTLYASGSSGNEITFTSESGSSPGSWDGIFVEGGQFSGYFEHNIVRYATYGLKLSSGSGGTIEYCNLNHNDWGIYLYNAGTTYIEDNTIDDNSQAGITSYYGSPVIGNNSSIDNSGADGLQFQNSSPTVYGDVIRYKYRGVVTSGSTVDMGSSCQYGGYNSVYSNSSYELYDGSGLIYAHNNWWGYPRIPWGDFYQGGTILAFCYLNSDPNIGKRFAVNGAIADPAPELDELLAAIDIRKSGDYKQAFTLMSDLLNQYYKSNDAPYILMEIEKTLALANKAGVKPPYDGGIQDYLYMIIKRYSPKSITPAPDIYLKGNQLYAAKLIQNREWSSAKEKLEQIRKEFANSSAEEQALYDLAVINTVGSKNVIDARKALSDLEILYPTSRFIFHCKMAMGEPVSREFLKYRWNPGG